MNFINNEHEETYLDFCRKAGVHPSDFETRSMLYLFSSHPDVRNHICDVFDLKNRRIKPNCLDETWQTGSSLAVITIFIADGKVLERIP